MLELLSLPPIQRGFLVLLAAGVTFPVTGVFILRLNLLTMRFMLMHGALLGGAVALALGWDPLLITVMVNGLLIGAASLSSQRLSLNSGFSTTFFMVFAMAAAFAVMYKFNVPARDTLELLWGNLFAVSRTDLVITVCFGLLLVLFYFMFQGSLNALIFDRDVARTSGVPADLFTYIIMFLTGFTVAFSLQLIGALLLDALLLLPAIVASFYARSIKGIVLLSMALGGLFSLAGFILGIALDIPISAGVVMAATVAFIFAKPLARLLGRT
ncbi:MAG: metal ABC transporter permease [Spirochaetales bacterium]|nr:metal ABC transporter permease [Spirochaetales bacterium]